MDKRHLPARPLSSEQFNMLYDYVTNFLIKDEHYDLDKLNKAFQFQKIYLSVKNFPTLDGLLARNSELLEGLPIGQPKIICPELKNFFTGIKQLCRGVLITIDYGTHTFSANRYGWRTYGGNRDNHDIFLHQATLTSQLMSI